MTAQDNRTLILTPNLTIAHQLRKERLQTEGSSTHGVCVGPTPAIFSIDHWLSQLASEVERELIRQGQRIRIAHADQESALWQLVVQQRLAQTMTSGIVQDARQLAREAHSVWRQLEERLITTADLDDPDTALMEDWISAFEKALKSRHLCTEKSILLNNKGWVKSFFSSRYDAVVRVGFVDPISPFQATILDACTDQQTEQQRARPCATSVAYGFAQREQELIHAAAWADAVTRESPTHRVAIVIPRLREMRPLALRTFSRILNDRQAFRVYPPRVLSDFEIALAALDLLELNFQKRDQAYFRRLIQCPYWCTSEPLQSERPTTTTTDWQTMIETALYATQSFDLKPTQFRTIVAETLDSLGNAIDHSITQRLWQCNELSRHKTDLSPMEWAELFARQLKVLGWPGNRLKSESELWAIEAIDELFDRLAKLNSVMNRCDLIYALGFLRDTASTLRERSYSGASAIDLIDTVEGVSGHSHVWLVGASQREWPQPPSPSPLLPIRFQIEHQLPRASVAQELAVAKQLLAQLQRSTESLVFSYILTDESGERAQRLTPLLQEVRIGDLSELPIPPVMDEDSPTTRFAKTELIDCTQGPPLPIAEREQAKGGAYLLQQMAACPFTTFVKFRLGADALPEPTLGFTALDRGNLTHKALELIWKPGDSQETYRHFSADQLRALCKEAAAQVVRQHQKRLLDRLPEALCELEIARLSEILYDWLEVELNGRSAFSVLAVEAKQQVILGPLHLDVRVDRIDQTAAGQLILDYKTSRTLSQKAWNCTSAQEPPAEPQLPLYAITANPLPVGIAFVQINAENQKIIGLGKIPVEQNKAIQVIPDWEEQIALWRDALTQLAENYAAGDCRITQKPRPSRFNPDPFASVHRWAEFMQWSDTEEELPQ